MMTTTWLRRPPIPVTRIQTRLTVRLTPTRVRRLLPAVAFAWAACNPASSRPGFMPYPEDVSVELTGTVPAIASAVGGWFEAQGIHTGNGSARRTGYVESTWYNTDSRQSTVGHRGPGDDDGRTFKVRVWVDPDAPGKSKMTVEAVYRPAVDPSRTERDLERSAPPGSRGQRCWHSGWIDEMQSKFGGS